MKTPRTSTLPFRPAWIVLALGLAAGIDLLACDIPVFRWALEHWGAQGPHDCYEVTVFHRGILDETSRVAVEALEKKAWPEADAANVVVRTVDVTEPVGPKDEAIWDTLKEKPLPRAVLRYPPVSRITVPVWDGPLDEGLAGRLLDSPLRDKIAKDILGGKTAVWILVECGNAEKDGAAVRTLGDNLKKLEETLEIQEPEDFGSEWLSLDEMEEKPDTSREKRRPSFALERVSRSEAGEDVVLRMLLRSESDLEEASESEPVCFPVFGRGRFLYALVGKGIREDNIDEPCTYLVGMCSCEVKWGNPGLDLLMHVRWDVEPEGPSIAPTRAVTLVAPPVSSPEPSGEARGASDGVTPPVPTPEPAPASPGSARSEDVRAGRPDVLRTVALTVGGLVAVAGIVALLVVARRAPR